MVDTTYTPAEPSVSHLAETRGGYNPPRKEHSYASKACECSECGEWFTTDKNFLMHQLLTEDWVRCLSAAELRKKGLVQNVNGVWHRVRKAR